MPPCHLFFDKCCSAGLGWDIDEIEKICARLELKTLEDSAFFASGLIGAKFELLYPILNPVLSIDTSDFKRCTSYDLTLLFESYFPQAQRIFGDASYLVIPETKLADIISQAPTNRYRTVGEGRDCDDFSRIFRGWLSTSGVGNLSIGYFEFEGAGPDFFKAHAGLAAVVETRENTFEIVFIEPSTKKIIPNHNKWLFGMNSMKARIIWF